ncbi:MAG: prepilin peptidase [Microbacterium sp.]
MDRILVALAYAVFAGVSLWLIRSDIRAHRLPNAVVLPGAGVVAALLASASALQGTPANIVRMLVGAGVLGGFYLILWSVGRGAAMGGGDVKLALLVGAFLAWHGWTPLAIGAAAAFVVGGAVALALVALGRADRGTRIAFAPFMLLGACLGPLVG